MQKVLKGRGYVRRSEYLASATGPRTGKGDATTTTKERFLALKTPSELEACFRDPTVNGAIYARTTLITKKGMTTEVTLTNGKTSTQTDAIQEAFNNFLRDSDFDNRYKPTRNAKDVYGKGAVELKYDDPETKGELLGLASIVDIVNFDYQRDSNQRILIDEETNKPKGFIQKDPAQPKNNVLFDPQQIAFFHHNPFGGYEPYSFLEPIYNVTESKSNIEVGIGQAVYRLGFPILEGIVGSEENPASASEIIDEAKALSSLVFGQDIYVHDHKKELKVHYPQSIRDIQSSNEYMLSQISTGLKIPMVFLMGKAEIHATTISKEARQYFMDILQGEQRSDGRIIENQIFRVFIKTNYPKVDLNNIRFHIKWPEISSEDLDSLSLRNKVYGELGVMTTDEIRDTLDLEPLKPEDIPIPKKVTSATEYNFG